MAFSYTVLSKQTLPGGQIMEIGTWALTLGSMSGNITPSPATTTPTATANPTEIVEIDYFSLGSTTDSSLLVGNITPAGVGARTILKLSSVANDSGSYAIIGRAS